MKKQMAIALTTAALLLMGLLISPPPAANAASSSSLKVALIPSAGGQEGNGGEFPTTGFPDGYAPTFTDVTLDSIANGATDPLADFDTAVLVQVCDIGTYLADAEFKSRLEGFVAGGGKLLIWDSECEATDYSSFIFPFETSNPGAAGAQGTLSIVENSRLGSSDPASPWYINTSLVGSDTDAVGDANVFVTFSGSWCAGMSAVNILGVNGPVQAYARYGNGIIVYQGLDMDVLGYETSFDPSATTGEDHLARIWLLQLLLPFNPVSFADLPCGIQVFGLNLDPDTATATVGSTHVVTATATSNAQPVTGTTVGFVVKSGPNAGTTATAVTDAAGKATFTYVGAGGPGVDVIEATATIGDKAASATSQVTWTAPEEPKVLPEVFSRNGYVMVAGDGGVFASGPDDAFGDGKFLGAAADTITAPQSLRTLNAPVVGMALTTDREGYWLAARDGGVFSIADAPFAGSLGGVSLGAPVTGIAADPDGAGYWLVAEDGGVFAFDAPFYGSLGGTKLNARIVAMAATPTGQGYWLVAEDGGVFTFGDATFSGSLGAVQLNKPIVGMTPDVDKTGYYLVAADGGVFAFDAVFHGSAGSMKLNAPVTGIAADPDGSGYWLAATDGGVFAFESKFLGSVAHLRLNQPVADIVST